jgi:WD40 repeat protein
MYHRGAIENSGLQAYASALMFSPRNSLIRRHFQHEEPGWMTIVPAISDSWTACLQTLEGYSSGVFSVAFSHDSTWLASASGTSTILESGDNTVKVWDASSGRCLQTLQGHSSGVYSVAFSHDSTQLASASGDKTVKMWDLSSGRCLQTLQGHSRRVCSVVFAHDSTRLPPASTRRRKLSFATAATGSLSGAWWPWPRFWFSQCRCNVDVERVVSYIPPPPASMILRS